MPEHAGMTSLGALTALRNLKFDLARHHSMSDALRQLARLRLTSLSLPGLCPVRMCIDMPATHQLVSHSSDSQQPLQGGPLQSTLSQPGIQSIILSLCWVQGDHGGALAELVACKTSLRELSIRGAARGPHLMAAVAGASLPIVLERPILWLPASLHTRSWRVAALQGRASWLQAL